MNSKFSSKSDFGALEGGRGFLTAVKGGAVRGMKPWEVGRVERMMGWLRRGTWKIAQPRGTWSHLLFVSWKFDLAGGMGKDCREPM